MFRVYFVLVIKALLVTSGPSECDSNFNVVMEGNVGETALFPWLGVLKVYLYEEDLIEVALTGIVYVKEGYAIGNADDVARIPKKTFKKNSEAVFIPTNQKPWSCSLVDYMTHPEYESTKNTIALLELDLGRENSFPMKPICWPPDSYRSIKLYAVGFTDENKNLEKSIYAVQYLDQTNCQQFYDQIDLPEKHMPSHWQCGFAKDIGEECIWENGMALASNFTDKWTLVGLGIRGPGCAAPARFIDIFPFLSWIESATGGDAVEIADAQVHRKSAFSEGFKNTRRKNYFPSTSFWLKKCSNTNLDLMYQDEIKINSYKRAEIEYKIELHDERYVKVECIKIYLKYLIKGNPEHIFIKYITGMELNKKNETYFNEFANVPEKLLKVFPVPLIKLRPKTPLDPNDWTPGPSLQVSYLEDDDDDTRYKKQTYYFLFHNLQVVPENEFELLLQLYGPLSTTTEYVSTTPTTTESNNNDQ